MYNKRTWLNKNNSAKVGNVVAFDGEVLWKEEKIRSIFLSISDCSVSVRIHKDDNDTIDDFIDKIKLLKDEIELFINYLEKNN